MAEVDSGKTPTLSEQYLLKDKGEEKTKTDTKPAAEETEVEAPTSEPSSEEVVTPATEETPAAVESSEPAAETTEETAGETKDDAPNADESAEETAPAEETTESTEPEVEEEEKPEIKLETAPADFRFPTTNQSRHCFTRYIEYHRCVAAKGEGAPECDKFAKFYRSLCPGEWVDRWNEQRENGTFPGPL
jgi:cytochrome c oxidase subunit 6b